MTTSTELIGPLKVGKVTFTGGPSEFRRNEPGHLFMVASHATVIYDVPTDTRDPRHDACTDHQVIVPRSLSLPRNTIVIPATSRSSPAAAETVSACPAFTIFPRKAI